MFLSARSLALATGPSTSSTLLHEETQLIPSLDNDDVGSEEGERSNEDGSDLAGSSDDEDDSMQSLSAAEDAPSEEEPSENRYYLLPRRVVTKDAMFPRFLFTMKIMVFFFGVFVLLMLLYQLYSHFFIALLPLQPLHPHLKRTTLR